MQIAIIDDSEFMRKRIINILTKEFLISEITSFASIKDYEDSKNNYDLLLLDIELPNENGIDYVNKNPQEHAFVIYVTSHDDAMSNAFNLNVIGFIMKVDIDKKLLLEVKKAEARLQFIKVYYLKTVFETLKVKESQILYFCSEDSIVFVQLMNHNKLIELTVKTLSVLEKKISENFFRVNRNYIINLKKVQRIDIKSKEIFLSNHISIKVSRRLWKDFKTRYGTARYHK